MDVNLVATVDSQGFIEPVSEITLTSLPAFSAPRPDAPPAIILGRNTHEAVTIKAPEDLHRIILSSDPPSYTPPRQTYTTSIPKALAHAHSIQDNAVYVVGGTETFAQLFPYASHLYLTQTEVTSPTTQPFPEINPKYWVRFGTTSSTQSDFEVYRRKSLPISPPSTRPTMAR
jgi:dihydrofolate reductase